MANDELLKSLHAIIDNAWSHVTPGTPDHAYAEQVKRQLRDAISPAPVGPFVAAKTYANKIE